MRLPGPIPYSYSIICALFSCHKFITPGVVLDAQLDGVIVLLIGWVILRGPLRRLNGKQALFCEDPVLLFDQIIDFNAFHVYFLLNLVL